MRQRNRSIQPHIFDDFFRADNVGAAPGSGLSGAHKIMDAHEGKTGTRFTGVIPRNLRAPEMRRDAQSNDSTLAKV